MAGPAGATVGAAGAVVGSAVETGTRSSSGVASDRTGGFTPRRAPWWAIGWPTRTRPSPRPVAATFGLFVTHGLWQVSGRSELSWEETVRLDLRYVENWSVTLDLTILWKTINAVTRGRGAY
jgi:Bacterial sugar transferase